MYHLSNTDHYEGSIETDERFLHEENFFIVHDDLVLMIAKETITWMKDNNYFRHWLLPMNGL